MSVLKYLRENLKRERLALKLSQQAFAEKLGLEYKYYQKIEAGAWPGLQLRTVEKMAKALGVEVAELVRKTE